MGQEHTQEIDCEAWITGDIEVEKDSIGDQHVIGGTQTVYGFEAKNLRIIIGIDDHEIDITMLIKNNKHLWKRIKENYIKDYKEKQQWKR